MMYPNEEDIKFGNKDLSVFFGEKGETDVGIGFVIVLVGMGACERTVGFFRVNSKAFSSLLFSFP
jgi:hypothetical protein